MNKPEDFSARQQALDISHSYIVKAPAGSGKTTLLVKRYLKLLAVARHPEEIIAITFTRKAAGELIARVMTALTEEMPSDSDAFIDHELVEIARQARQRDLAKGWQLKGNPSRIRIQTIDSLCNYIVRQMPWSAGFGAAPSTVSDDVSPMYLQAARGALLKALNSDHHKTNAEHLLAALDNDFSRACELIKVMLGRRDQWQGIIARHSGADARELLQTNWAQTAESVLNHCLAIISQQDQQEIMALGRYAAANLNRLGIESSICEIENSAAFPAAQADQVKAWKAITTLLLKKDNTNYVFRRSSAQGITKTIGFPAVKDGGDPHKKKRFQALLDRINNRHLESSLALVATLPAADYSDTEWQLLESLISLLRMAQLHLLDIFQRNGSCDHIEIASRALLALGQTNDEGPSELTLRLDYAIQHLLVDEFQDTSQTQMMLFNRLTAGWQGGDQRTVFFVGDPMQSIYRFRQADVGLFLNVFNNGFENTPVSALTLTTNFRSDKAIVDWVNHTFTELFPQRDDMQFGAVGYVKSDAYHRTVTPQSAQTTHVVNADDEASEVCQLINLIRQQSPDCSIAILVRARTHLAEIVSALQQASINYQGIKIEPLSQRSCIQDIMALTAALLHFGDKLAWLAVLRAPWCGLRLEDLTLIAEQAKSKTVWQVINVPAQQRSQALSDLARIKLDRFVTLLSPLLERVGRAPLNHVVAGAWHALCGPQIINASESDNIRTYISLLAEIEQAGGLTDLNQLQTAMQDLWAISGNSAGNVQLMTIHTAKGLEFDTVILPGLSRRPRVDDTKLLVWKEFLLDAQRSALLVSPIRQSDDEARYRFVQSLEKQSDREEFKRLLYVAATRAKNQLHLFLNPSSTAQRQTSVNTGTSFQSLLQPYLKIEENSNTERNLDVDQRDRDALKSPQYFCLNADHKPAKYPHNLGLAIDDLENELVEYEWVGISARHEGTLLHAIICQIANGTFVESSIHHKHWHNQLLSLGMPPTQIKTSIEKMQLGVDNMLGDPIAKWILDPSHLAAKNEWPVSAIIDNRLENVVIDRTFKDKHGVRWIIDYKTSTHEGANVNAFLDSEYERYRQQLEKYAAILRLSESQPIKLGLYFPLLKAWREWDYAG